MFLHSFPLTFVEEPSLELFKVTKEWLSFHQFLIFQIFVREFRYFLIKSDLKYLNRGLAKLSNFGFLRFLSVKLRLNWLQ